MTTYLCHFHVNSGVALTLDLVLDDKQYDATLVTAAAEHLARKLGITFIYVEEKTDGQ